MENTKKVIITPIVQTITVGYKEELAYTFDELPESMQQSLIDNFDRKALEDGFFDAGIYLVVGDLIDTIYGKYKLPVTRIPWDLSCCQGSGATFATDIITGGELKEFIKTTFPTFAKSFRWPCLFDYFCDSGQIEFREDARYQGFNHVWYSFDFDLDGYPNIDNFLNNKVDEFEENLNNFASDLSGDIYKKLDIAHDEVTNDEVVMYELQEHYYNSDGFIMDEFVKEVATNV